MHDWGVRTVGRDKGSGSEHEVGCRQDGPPDRTVSVRGYSAAGRHPSSDGQHSRAQPSYLKPRRTKVHFSDSGIGFVCNDYCR